MPTPRVEPMPKALAAGLKKDPLARAAFQKMPPSHQREWLKYINEAKRPETTLRRVDNALARLAKPVEAMPRAAK